MKRIIITLVVAAVTLCANAQRDVTKFLGIPVDGSKSEMIQKLKAKGFKPTSHDKNILEGTFNGAKVHINIVTNGDKVCRLMVCDVNPVDIRSIKIRFNNLCPQFENNPKYISFGYKLIPDDEDIAYEMIVKNKRYEATFCQKPILLTEPSELEKYLKTKYNEVVWDNLTSEQQAELTKHSMEISLKKPVWFVIEDYYGKYYIILFYDNEYNRANGEDL